MALLLYLLGFVVLLAAYLWQCQRAVSITHPEAAKLAHKPWTKEEIREAYRREEKDPVDVKKFLPKKLGRRYIVTGGSGGSTAAGSTMLTLLALISSQACLAAGSCSTCSCVAKTQRPSASSTSFPMSDHPSSTQALLSTRRTCQTPNPSLQLSRRHGRPACSLCRSPSSTPWP